MGRYLRTRIARDGRPAVLVVTALAAAAAAVGLAWGGALWIPTACLGLLLAALLFFVRDPERSVSPDPSAVLAPADGRVIHVGEVREEEWRGEPSLRISIFLSLLDVHVNRYPVSGVVAYRRRWPGSFRSAWRERAAEGNERLSLGIVTEDGTRVLVRQVAGLVARRIANRARQGDRAVQGARMGMILFGSRTDVFLPRESEPMVRRGDRAVGGITVLARLP